MRFTLIFPLSFCLSLSLLFSSTSPYVQFESWAWNDLNIYISNETPALQKVSFFYLFCNPKLHILHREGVGVRRGCLIWNRKDGENKNESKSKRVNEWASSTNSSSGRQASAQVRMWRRPLAASHLAQVHIGKENSPGVDAPRRWAGIRRLLCEPAVLFPMFTLTETWSKTETTNNTTSLSHTDRPFSLSLVLNLPQLCSHTHTPARAHAAVAKLLCMLLNLECVQKGPLMENKTFTTLLWTFHLHTREGGNTETAAILPLHCETT